MEFCPTEALELDTGFNKKGYHPPVLAREEDCTGCDLCGLFCPDFAIFGKIVKKKKSKIYFLLDASGSMASNLLDGQSRAKVVSKSVKKLTEILDRHVLKISEQG